MTNLLCGWAAQGTINSGVSFHGGNSFYCACESARDELTNIHSWVILDGGLQCASSTDDFCYHNKHDLMLDQRIPHSRFPLFQVNRMRIL